MKSLFPALSPYFYSAFFEASSMSGRMASTGVVQSRRASLLSLRLLSSSSPAMLRSGQQQQLLTCGSCQNFHAASLSSRPSLSMGEKVDCQRRQLTNRKAAGGTLLWNSKRFLWGWLNSIFNRVDPARIQEVGPDRACAEWLLRCGAGVKWDKASDEWLRDYNSLPAGNYRHLKISEIDATDSAVMHIGFPHFEGLTHVKKATFHRCMYLEDEGVRRIGLLKDTLEELQISSCGNVTDEGILTLVQMKSLKKLKLYDFLEVRNRMRCLAELQTSLPNCDIHFPFARESDRDPSSKAEEGKEKEIKKS